MWCMVATGLRIERGEDTAKLESNIRFHYSLSVIVEIVALQRGVGDGVLEVCDPWCWITAQRVHPDNFGAGADRFAKAARQGIARQGTVRPGQNSRTVPAPYRRLSPSGSARNDRHRYRQSLSLPGRGGPQGHPLRRHGGRGGAGLVRR